MKKLKEVVGLFVDGIVLMLLLPVLLAHVLWLELLDILDE